MPPHNKVSGRADTRPESSRLVVIPVNTTDVNVNIKFMARGHTTFKPSTFHMANIIMGNPGYTTLTSSYRPS